MIYLNLDVSVIRRPEYVGAEPVQRATWLNLIAYSADQENGGTITGCRSWKCRRWQQTCGVTAEEVNTDSDLWSWDGDDLLVWEYPLDKEQEVRGKRESGRKGGSATSEAKAQAARENGSQGGRPPKPKENPSTEPKQNPTEGKGKEGNEKEGNTHTLVPLDHEIDLPKGCGADMLDLEARVRALKEGWRLPFSYQEQQLLMQSARTLQSLTLEDWAIIRSYLGAKLPEGMPGLQPRSRARFLEWAGDVFEYSLQWHRKQQKAAVRTAPKLQPVQSDEPPMTKEELVGFFRKTAP